MAYSVYRNTNQTFLSAKDQVYNASPINLISVHIKGANATMFFCQYTDGQSITYFKPGTAEEQVYTPAPFRIGALHSNIEGRIDNLSLELTNINNLPGQNNTISEFLHAYDGLRGCEVNVLKVFRGGLSDSDANMRDIYYIDSCSLDQSSAKFTLTSKFEVQGVTLPFRKYRRDQCQWTFNSEECNPRNLNPTITAAAAAGAHCRKTIASCDITYENVHRFGGFPSIPTRRVIR